MEHTDVQPSTGRTCSRRRRRLALLLGAAALVLAAAPAGASAAPSPGCTTPDAGTVKHYTCYIAPITVAGYEVKQNIAAFVPKPPGDGAITHFETDVVDENADPIPISRLMLHHIVFSNLDAGDLTCTGAGFSDFGGIPIFGGYAPERFAGRRRGAGEAEPAARLRLRAQRLGHAGRLVYMLMNHKPTTDTAYVQYKLTVDTSGTVQPVRPYWLDVNNCKADPIYNVPGAEQARRA